MNFIKMNIMLCFNGYNYSCNILQVFLKSPNCKKKKKKKNRDCVMMYLSHMVDGNESMILGYCTTLCMSDEVSRCWPRAQHGACVWQNKRAVYKRLQIISSDLRNRARMLLWCHGKKKRFKISFTADRPSLLPLLTFLPGFTRVSGRGMVWGGSVIMIGHPGAGPRWTPTVSCGGLDVDGNGSLHWGYYSITLAIHSQQGTHY